MRSRVSDAPKYAPLDYRTKYKERCIPERDDFEAGQGWHYGTGIPPGEHPLREYIDFGACEACGSADVLVVAAQWSVSYASGDKYWDYELVCGKCGRYTQSSYDEK